MNTLLKLKDLEVNIKLPYPAEKSFFSSSKLVLTTPLICKMIGLGSKSVMTVRDLLKYPGRPRGSKLALINPDLPCTTGVCDHPGVVQPQDACTDNIFTGKPLVLVKTNS